MERLLKRHRIQSQLVKECLAEFLALYIGVLIGAGCSAQVLTSKGEKGDLLSIQIGSALGAIFAVLIARGASGAHLNPVYTLSMCVLGRSPWKKLPCYALSHLLGAFLGAATVYLHYYDAIHMYNGGKLTVAGPNATAGIFSSYPADYLSLWGGVVDQVIGSAVLLFCVLALEDLRLGPIPDGLQPVLVGALILAIGVSMGSNCGFPLNPATDLGPRLFTFVAGWGVEVFKAGWWWVPLVAPCVGALLGSVAYELLIRAHHLNTPQEEPSPGQELEDVEVDVELDEVVVEQVAAEGVEPAVVRTVPVTLTIEEVDGFYLREVVVDF